MAILTISRQMASGGDTIAQEVAKILGWAYFDKELLRYAAMEAGLSTEHIVDFSEDSYPIRDFWDHLLGDSDKIALAKFKGMDKNGTILLSTELLDEDKCLAFIQSTLYYLKNRGNTVIVGRGGQALFKDYHQAFHIRIIAPLSKRVENFMAKTGMTKENSIEHLRKRDAAAAQYIKRFYNEDWNNPLLYHMVINTGLMDETVVSQILADSIKRYFSYKQIQI
ncbi:MAG: cytidylate kinase-like family protein [Candidatus Eremiobacteraeota bacterium]|nr:cytidylate kinase-like family protein [Candidatus Eremiobacteraeota bacterium]